MQTNAFVQNVYVYFLREQYFFYVFGGLECVGHSFAYVAHFIFLRDTWIRTQRAAVASRCATHLSNFANHLPNLAKLSHPSH
jgi:hypothetical protein